MSKCRSCGVRTGTGTVCCGPCSEQQKQTRLLREQTRILRQDRSNTNSYQEEATTQNSKEDFWIPILIFICTGVVMSAWDSFKAIWEILVWPFAFLWNSSKTIYTSLTKLIGWQHTVNWWEVVLFLTFVWLLLFLIFSDEKE